MVETFYRIPALPVFTAVLADYHNGNPDPILASLRQNRPDLIVIAGDLVYGSRPEGEELIVEKQAGILPLLNGCAVVAPTFLSLGNHDWALCGEDLARIAGTGVTVLDNRWEAVTLRRAGDGASVRLLLGGLTSGQVTDYRRRVDALPPYVKQARRYPVAALSRWHGKRGHPYKPDGAWLPDFAAQDGYKLLLCHHPEHFRSVPPSVDLVISGHAHGGQWRMFHRGLYAPGQGWFPQYTSGVYENRLVVSRGLTNTVLIPRFHNPPETVYLLPA